MTSLFEQAVAARCDEYLRSKPFKDWLSTRIKWSVQGFEDGYRLKDREAFTETVAKRIRSKARRPIYLFGHRIWRARCPQEFCADEAERIVTEFIRGEKIKFGNPRYDWTNGHDLADEDMNYWEACP